MSAVEGSSRRESGNFCGWLMCLNAYRRHESPSRRKGGKIGLPCRTRRYCNTNEGRSWHDWCFSEMNVPETPSQCAATSRVEKSMAPRGGGLAEALSSAAPARLSASRRCCRLRSFVGDEEMCRPPRELAAEASLSQSRVADLGRRFCSPAVVRPKTHRQRRPPD